MSTSKILYLKTKATVKGGEDGGGGESNKKKAEAKKNTV